LTDRPVAAPVLLDAIRGNLEPVRPLLSPARRAILLLPVGLALLVAMPAFWGWRHNLATLGVAASWGFSAFEALTGLLIVGLALREAVPGRELSRLAIFAIVGCGALLFVGLALASELLAPVPFRKGVWLREVWGCLSMSAIWSVPALAVASWLAARAVPTRPAVAGAICGLGAGLMADSGLRLSCGVSTPAHVLVGHGAAIVLLVSAGAGAAIVIDRFRGRRQIGGP
jgi:hypothetical protein